MLPARHRRRDASQFRAVLRGARTARSGGRSLVVHAAVTDPTGERAPRVGFVVSAAVGGAVVRNRVKRRLRALVRDRLSALPTGWDFVVRAQSAAAGASSADLARDLDRALAAVERRLR